MRLLLILCALAVFCVGCRTYEPRPVDWTAEQAAWGTNRTTRVLTWAEARTVALLFNRDLRRLRLKAARARASARVAGAWEDPQLRVDVEKLIGAAGFGERTLLPELTIPVTGLPGLNKRIREAYADVDRAEIALAERNVLRTLAEAWAKRVRVLREEAVRTAFAETAARAELKARRLAADGEMTADRRDAVIRTAAESVRDRDETRFQVEAAERDLVRLLGLSPDEIPQFDVRADDLAGGAEAQPRDPLALTRHPAVTVQLARLKADEHVFRREIRKQYPEWTVGAGFGRDGGDKLIPLGMGLTLPLWNRNREGVADGEGARDLTRQDVIDTWKRLVFRAADARAETKKARTAVDLRRTSLRRSEDAAARARQLLAAGETSFDAWLEAESDACTARLALAAAEESCGTAESEARWFAVEQSETGNVK